MLGYFFAIIGGGELALLLIWLYNFLIWRRNRRLISSPYTGMLAAAITLFTTGVFLIQFFYQYYFGRMGCFVLISDVEAGVSYLTTMILFTITLWELGIGFLSRFVHRHDSGLSW